MKPTLLVAPTSYQVHVWDIISLWKFIDTFHHKFQIFNHVFLFQREMIQCTSMKMLKGPSQQWMLQIWSLLAMEKCLLLGGTSFTG